MSPPEPPAPPVSATLDAPPNPSARGAPALAAAAPEAPGPDAAVPDTATPGSRLADYDFALPPELIAQRPPDVRGASRLLHVDPAGEPRFRDRRFADLVGLLAPGDLLVMNDTRVVKARLFGNKATGGRVEVLVERIEGPQEAVAMIRSSHPPPTGSTLSFDGAGATVLARDGAFFRLRFDVPVPELLERAGSLPLPPYIQHVPDAQDSARYQTVYAAHPGAVAAPTAGLHFDEALLGTLAERGIGRAFVTLHVGAGTFMPVRDEDPARHVMHAERYHVPAETAEAIRAARARGGRIVAVGTTSLRTLEAASSDDGRITAGHGETALYIRPGYRFRAVDRLLTNFHLPRSTLMMLVSAFSGLETIRAAYAHAIAHRYRFFSYGDAMLLERARPSEAGTRE
jgi:S-adenosylmethionine:tRNA ribosyltransferase-isomerase